MFYKKKKRLLCNFFSGSLGPAATPFFPIGENCLISSIKRGELLGQKVSGHSKRRKKGPFFSKEKSLLTVAQYWVG
jgi:hypothetical protein